MAQTGLFPQSGLSLIRSTPRFHRAADQILFTAEGVPRPLQLEAATFISTVSTDDGDSRHAYDHLRPGVALFHVRDRCRDVGELKAPIDLRAQLARLDQP